jgi:DNA/RNA endonuclease G (NUC1)
MYENHILSYDQAKKTPIWVAEYITKKNTNGKSKKNHPTLFELFMHIHVIMKRIV